MRMNDIRQIAMKSRQHQLLPATITGTVTRIGYYGDTLPQLIIKTRKEDSGLLPYQVGERVIIPLVVNGVHYLAGIRTTVRSTTVMVCPDLNDSTGASVRLVDVLFSQGWTQAKVKLVVEDGAIYCYLYGE